MSRNARSRRSSRNSAHRNQYIANRRQDSSRFRRLRHEQLEDRRLLSGFAYNDFSDISELNLVGAAVAPTGSSNALRLTPEAQFQAGRLGSLRNRLLATRLRRPFSFRSQTVPMALPL